MSTRAKELENKQINEMITDIYQTLHEDDQVLSAPSSDHGIFKYIGYLSQTQYYLTKISRKREAQRSGLGFVIQWADFMDHFRISVDVEISSEVTGKEPIGIFESMFNRSSMEYGVQGPSIVLYSQPAYSGKRGWAEKTFAGFELELREADVSNLNRTKKRLLDMTRKLLHALDYSLSEN